MLVIMIGVLIIVLQIVVVDVTIVDSDFDKVDQFDDKIGINHILVSTECISACACGALCGQQGERCKSFFFYGEESLCRLYSEHLDNLQLNNKMGSKGYSVKHSLYSSVTPLESFTSTTSPPAATTSSTTDDTMTSGNTATSATDNIATSTSVTATEPCAENSGEAASGCTNTDSGGGTSGSSS